MVNIEKIGDYYNSFWSHNNIGEQERSDLREYEEEVTEYVLKYLKKYFHNLKGKMLLEIGPGKGHDVIQFAQSGAMVTAIDISKNSLESSKELAKKNGLLKKIKLIQMDAHDMKFRNNQFDVIFIKTTLMHLNYRKVINECKKVLKKDGILISIEPLNENVLIKLYRILFSKFKETKPKYLEYNDLIVISKNFRKYYIKVFYLFSFISLIFKNNRTMYNQTSKMLKKIENFVLKIFPRVEKNAWLAVSIYIK